MKLFLRGAFFAVGLLVTVPASAEFNSVRVQIIDRGQADGILIRTPNEKWVVIDAGTNAQQAEAVAFSR